MRYKIVFLFLIAVAAFGQASGNATYLQGRYIGRLPAPSDGQVLCWDAGQVRWEACDAGGGAPAFSSITDGTATSKTFAIGNGSALGVSGSGTINATSLGGTAAASYALLISPSFTTPALGAATGTSLVLTGSITSGSGSGVAGILDLRQGTLPSLGTTAISFLAPTSVTSYGLLYPGAAPAANQVLLWGTPSSSISTGVFTTFASTNLTDTATLARLAANQTWTGQNIFSLNGAASTPPLTLTGTIFTGGTNTTTKPQLLIEPTGATSNFWNTNGTGLGINAASGFTGDLIHVRVNGVSATRFVVNNAGSITATGLTVSSSILGSGDVQAGSTNGFYWSSRNYLTAPANGQVKLGNFDNNAGVTLDFTAAANELFIKNFANNAAGTIKAIYKSSDGTAGVTGATCTAWKDGLCTTL